MALDGAANAATPAAFDALAAQIRNKHHTFQQLVEALGHSLTTTDENLRHHGVLVLAEVVSRLVDAGALDTSIEPVVAFFAERIGDYLTMEPTLQGCAALARCAQLPADAPLRIVTSLLDRCDLRSLVQAQRHAAMGVLLALVQAHWPALAGSGTHLLLETVRSIDGEKDPRNLLRYFQLLRAMCARCEASACGGLDEVLPEIFEALMAYFPITFTPPPNDLHQITSQHLLQALLRTLQASPHFATTAMPYLAAKLTEEGDDDHETRTTRLQVLQSLSILSPTYGVAVLEPHADKLGEALGDMLEPSSSRGQLLTPSAQAAAGDAPLAADPMDGAVRQTLRTLAALAGGAHASGARSIMERLTAPAISRCVSAPPQGPGATAAGLTLTSLYAASAYIRAPLLRQALPALLRRLSAEGSKHADRADALALLHALLSCACEGLASGAPVPRVTEAEAAPLSDAAAATAAATAATAAVDAARGDIISELASHRASCLTACIKGITDELESDASPPLRHAAGHVICLALGPMLELTSSSLSPPASNAPSAPDTPAALKALRLALLSFQSSSCVTPALATASGAPGPGSTHAALVAVAADAARLRAEATKEIRAPFDAEVRVPLLTAFVNAATSPAGSGPGSAHLAAVHLAPVLAELAISSPGGGGEWGEGVAALNDALQRSVPQVLARGDGDAAEIAHACLRAFGRLVQPTDIPSPTAPAPAAPTAAAPLPAWLPPLLAWLVGELRRAAATASPPTLLPSLLDAVTPLWSAIAARSSGGGDGVSINLLTQCVPWLLPEASSLTKETSMASAHLHLTPLLHAALVHTPRAVALPPRTLASLLARALDVDTPPTPLELRCLCVAYNKWASAAEVDEALAAAHERAQGGSTAALSVWHSLGRAAACRGGKWTAGIPSALVALLVAPPPPTLAPQEHAAWRRHAARGIAMLMSPTGPDLLKERGAQLAPLLSQRLYTAIAPPLRIALSTNEQAAAATPSNADLIAQRAAMLEALSLCLVAAPTATLLAAPATAVPYLLQWLQVVIQPFEPDGAPHGMPAAAFANGMEVDVSAGGDVAPGGGGAIDAPAVDADQCDLLQAVLHLACALIRSLPEADAEPLGAIVPTMLTLLGAIDRALPLAGRVDTMASSIECLDACRALPPHRLLPHKKRVLRVLERALDHKKRRVRQAACKCANQWHLLEKRGR